MEGRQNIFYALGILAYAIAKSDGAIQAEEKDKLFEIIEKEMDHKMDFSYTEIVFQLLEKDKKGMEGTYQWAIQELDKGRHYLSPELKQKMIHVVEEIARAFNSVSVRESRIIERFKKDLEHMGSDHYLT